MAERSSNPAVRRVQEALAARGYEAQIVEFDRSTRTSAEAAAAIGCAVADIAKSIVFRGADSGRPVLVIASGPNRIDEGKVAALLGEPLAKADAAFVRASTGFVIGGVPPVGHARDVVTFIDADLLQRARIWAAAGTPQAVFGLTPGDLVRLSGGTPADIRQN